MIKKHNNSLVKNKIKTIGNRTKETTYCTHPSISSHILYEYQSLILISLYIHKEMFRYTRRMRYWISISVKCFYSMGKETCLKCDFWYYENTSFCHNPIKWEQFLFHNLEIVILNVTWKGKEKKTILCQI